MNTSVGKGRIRAVLPNAVIFGLVMLLGIPPLQSFARDVHPHNEATVASNLDMAYIPGGTFRMGAVSERADEQPVHLVTVSPFWIARHETTVAQFRRFVNATGYKTDIERAGTSKVFDFEAREWLDIKGSDWRHPDGPMSKASDNEPVVQVSWSDANAYAKWASLRLPSEAEWEFAARGGLDSALYAWGNELRPGGRPVANWWQGSFPNNNTLEDGYLGRAPVGKFTSNGYGLFDVTGNVWEWCADYYSTDYYAHSPRSNPRGPDAGTTHIVRGGSFLCSENFCTGFRVASRRAHKDDITGTNNMGFRCAR